MFNGEEIIVRFRVQFQVQEQFFFHIRSMLIMSWKIAWFVKYQREKGQKKIRETDTTGNGI